MNAKQRNVNINTGVSNSKVK